MPSATIISSLPTFITQEEHKTAVQSTPASFSDIPPVLRRRESDVTVAFDPVLEGLDILQGALYVAESALYFFTSSNTGFKIDYPAITLHAVSRAQPGPSIYCQLDEHAGEENAVGDEDSMEMRELTIIPQNTSSLEPIFDALSVCASLHPDAMEEDDELDDAFVDADPSAFETFDGTEGEELSEVGRAALEHLESIIVYPKSNGPNKKEGEGEGRVGTD